MAITPAIELKNRENSAIRADQFGKRVDCASVEVETMASDIPPGIPISPTLASLARRFDIDLSGLADEALTERILRDPMSALTPRMRSAFLAAQKLGRDLGHKHIGAEHVFLAILLDDHSLPSQIMQSVGTRNEVVEKIRTMLASESYNRPATS